MEEGRKRRVHFNFGSKFAEFDGVKVSLYLQSLL